MQASSHAVDSDDETEATDLFSDKQIRAYAAHYPNLPRLRKLIAELGDSSSMRMSTDMKRTSVDVSERVAAAGSAEVAFRSAVDDELSKTNQFFVSVSAELRSQVSGLETNSQDRTKNVDELLASVQRCMKQVIELSEFSQLSQSIILQAAQEHDKVSDLPAFVQTSEKLSYQPFILTKSSDLSGPLAMIERRLTQRKEDEMAAPVDAAAEGGLEAPLLTRRNTIALQAVERKPPTGFAGWLRRTFKPDQPNVTTGALKKLTPAKIEPKVYFANERTFLHWMHMCVTLGAVAMAIMAEGADDPSLALPGLLLTAFSAIFILYAWYMFMWRAEALKAKVDHLDDRVGPSLFVIAVLAGLAFVGYKKLEQASAAVKPY
ncbi:hypothetical protein KFE25_014079 [Diacronema lutheri]|uniref:DUF202 domain-containing protein n=1 Tax=Diacronema lutheri TaxID=2081491 RepID=A0A8J5X6T6_DIALT|nr:hypothetical protein KFE25_014079 [Diacronema lutheri]